MLIDELNLLIKAGKGGAGCVSFYPGRNGPDGGNGGRGGSVWVVAVNNLSGLNRYAGKIKIAAEDGVKGDSFRRHGQNAEDVVLEMPVGTSLTDQETGKVYELNREGERLMVCNGGRGGRGNEHFKTATYQAPRKAEPGLPGQEKRFRIVLKLIADFGLIGLPNAGKSSLLNELTSAAVKTANYPFTTLEANLGALPNGKILADIPGLIEGASEGKGLGIRFLKHIEKVKLLLHCVSSESDDVARDYKTVRKELENYKTSLIKKEEIILLTKLDMTDAKELTRKRKILEKLNPRVYTVSIHDWESLEQLKKLL